MGRCTTNDCECTCNHVTCDNIDYSDEYWMDPKLMYKGN